jgi:hypothetical protein
MVIVKMRKGDGASQKNVNTIRRCMTMDVIVVSLILLGFAFGCLLLVLLCVVLYLQWRLIRMTDEVGEALRKLTEKTQEPVKAEDSQKPSDSLSECVEEVKQHEETAQEA